MRDLKQVEKHRTGVVQFLILLIVVILGLIIYLSWESGSGVAVPMLALIALAGCLYAVWRDRRLKHIHHDLVQSILYRDRQVDRLGQRLVEERGKADKLGVRLDELTAIYRAISTVNAVQEVERTYNTVIEAALRLVNADCGSIMLIDPERRELAIRSASGLSDEVVANTRQPLEQGVAGWVVAHRESLLLNGSAEEDGRFRQPVERALKVKSALCVPLECRNLVLGVINLGVTEASPREQLSAVDESLAKIFAQHAAVAVHNARLLEGVAGGGGGLRLPASEGVTPVELEVRTGSS